MLVPDEIRKCVVFLCYQDSSGLRLAGTAFFVNVPMEGLGRVDVYLVTAKHVIEKIGQKSIDQKVYVRMNLKDGGTEKVPTHIDHWIFHPEDPSIDVAVLPWVPTATQVVFLSIPSWMAVTDQVIADEGIGPGDEVFITGLFVNHYGKRRNLPIIRIGNIALMPEEPVQTKQFGLIDAYLIECRSIGGLSGSPAFVHLAEARLVNKEVQMKLPLFYWLGLVHGHWDLKVQDTDSLLVDLFNVERVNMGIAIVVPAVKVMEVIDQEETVEHRRRVEEEIRKGSDAR